MSEEGVLVINTNSPTKIVEERIDPLVVFDDGHPSLKQPMPEFDESQISQEQIQKFIKQLKLTMKTYNGIGLSANQCGVKFRMFVMGSSEFQNVCINPRIIDTEGEPEKMREGCLSYPGLYLNIPRYKKILAEYVNEFGETKTNWFDGITAQVYQHELDHMNGIVYTDHVGPLALRMAKERQNKLIKKIKKAAKAA